MAETGGMRRAWHAAWLALACAASAAPLASWAESAADTPSFAARYAAVDGPVAPRAPDASSAGATEPPPKPALSASSPSAYPDTRAYYRALIEREATQQGLAPAIAEAVMAVESGYNPDSIGTSGEIGLMQIMPSTARMLGFVGGNAELAVPETNIHLGVSYLAQAWRLAGGDLCTAVMKYRAGHGETRFSYLSVNYCLAVRSKLFARGFPVTGSVPAATFGEAVGGGGGGGGRSCGRKCLGVTRIGKVDLTALNMKLSALVVQTRGGR
jgi:soluble lytic murein transglycosylase-like protein